MLGAVGRVLVTVGLLLLLFVAYQLWGTGIYQARAQNDLERAVRTGAARATASSDDDDADRRAGDHDRRVRPRPRRRWPPLAAPAEGDVVGRIGIPKIGVDQCVVEGVNVDDLRKGPGHYPSTQMPGHEGNSAIAGHRTTYGAPFGDLDQLVVGDEISVTTVQGDLHVPVVERRVVVARARSGARSDTRSGAPGTSSRPSRSRPATRSTPPPSA